jgi:type IV secretory pathway protease TraF
LLGDNASASTDSRNFGWVQAKTIIAKVVWPKL